MGQGDLHLNPPAKTCERPANRSQEPLKAKKNILLCHWRSLLCSNIDHSEWDCSSFPSLRTANSSVQIATWCILNSRFSWSIVTKWIRYQLNNFQPIGCQLLSRAKIFCCWLLQVMNVLCWYCRYFAYVITRAYSRNVWEKPQITLPFFHWSRIFKEKGYRKF